MKFKYNLLNLTERAEDLSGLEVVRYVYGYDGLKNRAISGAGIEYVYLGSLTYMGFAQSLNPESIVFPEGRITFSGQVPQTYYHLTDHLGSVRAILSSDGSARHSRSDYPQLAQNRYKYNGKESQQNWKRQQRTVGAILRIEKKRTV